MRLHHLTTKSLLSSVFKKVVFLNPICISALERQMLVLWITVALCNEEHDVMDFMARGAPSNFFFTLFLQKATLNVEFSYFPNDK